jgi:hypothetical protein
MKKEKKKKLVILLERRKLFKIGSFALWGGFSQALQFVCKWNG